MRQQDSQRDSTGTDRGHPAAVAWSLVATLVLFAAATAPALALEFHVDASTGDDSRSPLMAQSPATPWRTIGYALATVDTAAGRHTIRVHPGTYAESAATGFADVDLIAAEPAGSVVLTPPAGLPGLLIKHSGVVVENFRIEGGLHGIKLQGGARTRLRGITSAGALANGIHVTSSDDVVVENSTLTGAGSRGVLVEQSQRSYLRNLLVVAPGEWGVSIETPAELAPSAGHVLAFLTLVEPRSPGASGGGLRLQNALGEVRDSIVAGFAAIGVKTTTAPVTIHHLDVFGSSFPIDSRSGFAPVVWQLRFDDPGFVGNSDWRLVSGSPAIDAGSGLPADLDISGSALFDGSPDTGSADLGVHLAAAASQGTPLPAPTPTPTPAAGRLHVDCADGDDSRSREQARVAATPWRTLEHALLTAIAGDEIVVAAGTCTLTREIDVDVPNLTLRADTPGTVTLVAPPGSGVLVVQASGAIIEGLVLRSDHSGIVVARSDAAMLAEDVVLRELSVAPLDAAARLSTNGIQVRDARRLTVESCMVEGASQRGILLKRVQQAHVRNNRVTGSGEWAIDLDNSGTGSPPPLSTGNLVAFNTVAGNVLGVRLNNAAGEVRDNVIAFNGGTGLRLTDPGRESRIHHNLSFGNVNGLAEERNWVLPSDFTLWASNLSVDPKFRDLAAGDLTLAQTATGQPTDSPAVDAGSAPVEQADISGTTRSDGSADTGRADLGHHRGATASPHPAGGPEPAPLGATLYVDCDQGDDGRNPWEARVAWNPLGSVARALAASAPGDTIVVNGGTCTEGVEIDLEGLTLRSATPQAATIVPPAGVAGIHVRTGTVTIDGFRIRSDHEGILVQAADPESTIADVVVQRNEIAPPAGESALALNGIRIEAGLRPRIDSNVVRGAGQQGITIKRSINAFVRNNLVTGSNEWGVGIESGDGAPTSTDHVLAFNTITGNGTSLAAGGIHLHGATGEIRDNVITGNVGAGIQTDTAGTTIHHNLLFGPGVTVDDAVGAEPLGWDNLFADPLFVDAAAGDWRLAHVDAGQGATSPAIDHGSLTVELADISGTTRADHELDAGAADLGFHRDAAPASAHASPAASPQGLVRTLHVDPNTGNDARHALEAATTSRPWRTLDHALAAAQAGDTVSLAAGTYPGSAATRTTDVRIVTSGAPGSAVLAPQSGVIGLEIRHARTLVDGLAITGGSHAVRIASAPDSVLRRVRVSQPSLTGIRISDSERLLLDSVEVDRAGERGILAQRSPQLYLRNALITRSTGTGVHVEAAGAPTASGVVLAFATLIDNGQNPTDAGVRFENATGEIRDSIIAGSTGAAVKTDTAPTLVHHLMLHDNQALFETESAAPPTLWANRGEDPLFVDAAAVDGRLAHVDAGQTATSPAIDRGSLAVDQADISGTTRADHELDAGAADLGFHRDTAPSAGSPPPEGSPNPAPGTGTTYWVDPANGDNAHTSGEATSAAGAWRTITRALGSAQPGDIIQLAPGHYAEQVDITTAAITLRGAGVLGTSVLRAPAGEAGISVEDAADVRIENLVIEGGAQGLRAERASDLRITGVAIVSPTTTGIHVIDSAGPWIDSAVVTGAGETGILLRRSPTAYVRNALVHANGGFGLTIDGDQGAIPQPPVPGGNVVAFCTIYGNGAGLRVLGASGEIRDNDISGNRDLGLYAAGPDLLVHHNNFALNGRDRDSDGLHADSLQIWSNLGRSPRHLDRDGADDILGGSGWRDDDFRLEQLAAGDSRQSPLVDSGSGAVTGLDISGSTARSGAADSGTADIGHHHAPLAASGAPAAATAPPLTAATYFVSVELGDDSRSSQDARQRDRPWRTIDQAVRRAASGDQVVVLPGLYGESVQIETAGISLLADLPGTVFLLPGAGNALTVEAPDVTIDGFIIRGGQTGISILGGADRTRVSNCTVLESETDGIRAQDVSDVRFEHVSVSTSLYSGILLRRTANATVSDALVYANGEWGVSFANGGSDDTPVAEGNTVERSTLAFNGLGNLRLANARAVVRDNLLTDTAGVGFRADTPGSVLLHNGFASAATAIDPPGYLFCAGCTGNHWIEPRYVDPAGRDGSLGGRSASDDDFRLSSIAAGQPLESEAIDAGSVEGATGLSGGTTSTDGAPDTGVLDLGYHYQSSARDLPPPPWAGTGEAILFVDPSIGDDSRSRADTTHAETPWRTLRQALREARRRDVIVLAPGTYAEALRVQVGDLTIRGSGAPGATRIAPGPRNEAMRLRGTGITLENLWIDGARRGIVATAGTRDLVLRNVIVTSSSREGLSLSGDVGTSIEGGTLAGNRGGGLRGRNSSELTLRDVRVYANPGVGVALSGGSAALRFVTVHQNGREGVRAVGTALAVENSILTDNEAGNLRFRPGDTPVIHHVLLDGGRSAVVPEATPLGPGVQLDQAPLFVDPDGADDVLGGAGWQDDDLSLAQTTAGALETSPAVDAGSDSVEALGVTGATATTGQPDSGQADLGAHR